MYRKLLNESQLHGVRRAMEKRYGWCWLVVLLLLFAASVNVVLFTVLRYLQNPTHMVHFEIVNETDSNFPSVHICPEIIFSDKKIDAFVNRMEIPPPMNATYLKRVFKQLAAFISHRVPYNVEDLKNIESFIEYNEYNVMTVVKHLYPACKEILLRCYSNYHKINCTDLFRMQLTGDGFCCVFNGKSIVKKNYSNPPKDRISYASFGYSNSLAIAVNNPTSQRPYSQDSAKRYAVHTAKHYVESSFNGTTLNTGYELWVSCRIEHMIISENGMELNDNYKKCRLASTPLKHFDIYKRKYCLIECEMYRAVERCGCVQYQHPPIGNSTFCRAEQLQCLRESTVSFDNSDCNCLHTCSKAHIHVTQSCLKMDPNLQPLDQFYTGLNLTEISVLRVFMEGPVQRYKERISYFTHIEYLSQFGGIFNLFFGCSFLTLLEFTFILIYCCKSWTSKSKVSVGPEEDLVTDDEDDDDEIEEITDTSDFENAPDSGEIRRRNIVYT